MILFVGKQIKIIERNFLFLFCIVPFNRIWWWITLMNLIWTKFVVELVFSYSKRSLELKGTRIDFTYSKVHTLPSIISKKISTKGIYLSKVNDTINRVITTDHTIKFPQKRDYIDINAIFQTQKNWIVTVKQSWSTDHSTSRNKNQISSMIIYACPQKKSISLFVIINDIKNLLKKLSQYFNTFDTIVLTSPQ